MPKLTIDDTEIEVVQGTSVLQACEQLGIEVPRFCYHDKLSVPANCRMCLVEIEKTPKPVASCAMPCGDGMVVRTSSPVVQKARKGVMEMLLINHPLDCPICDQGGECDLQDQAVAYGFDRSRFQEAKRAVKDKELGPLVKTVMTRCIHCTRCVRFVDEICGTPELGTINRGEKTEISTYVTKALTSEMSGNLIDVCPVGALTSKPTAFTARPWEYQKNETIDVMDAVGSNIRVDVRGNEVLRVLPRLNEDVNEVWISDKTRFAFDGLKRQRLDRPYVRKNGKLVAATWDEAFAAIADRIRETSPSRMGAIAGDLADCETMFALKSLLSSMGCHNMDCRQDGASYDVSTRAAYVMNSGIAGIDQADAVVLVGVNPRHEAAVINARLRKRWLRGGMRVAVVGAAVDLGYPYQHIGSTPQSLLELTTERHAYAQILKNAKNPMVLVGAHALARTDGAQIHGAVRDLVEKFTMVRDGWNGFNVLQSAAGRVGGLDLGFLPQGSGLGTRSMIEAASAGKLDLLWLLGADEIDMSKLGSAFVVYQGHHGDAGAHRADVILPGAAYTEKNALYVNTEGRPQMAQRAVFPPGEAKEDWTIVRAFSAVLGKTLPFDTVGQLRTKMFAVAPHLADIGACPKNVWTAFGMKGEQSTVPLMDAVHNFYMTDVISRASVTMAQCTEEILPLLDQRSVKKGVAA